MAASMSLETDCGNKLPATAKQDKAVQKVQRAQWLRAAILGANDGLLSTASLLLGIGAAKDDRESMIISGMAGALAGACSMAVGEFVSVSTQKEIEKSMIIHKSLHDLDVGDRIKLQISTAAHPSTVEPKLTEALATPNRSPFLKLACESELPQGKFYPFMQPGQSVPHVLTPSRSPTMKVVVEDARVTMAKQDDGKEDALPNPYKAAAASALAFLCGSAVPLVATMAIPQHVTRIVVIMVVTSVALVFFGGLGALLGGSPIRISAVRVLLGGWISMAITFGLIKAFDRDHEAHESL
ncbi:hypothetical protein ACH5RR_013505 [Cinchona calisaya]|uniref:Vacuolar iron transporter n=1 Tax=Cinchona calisaya TaxID=153742 RepID=A0ABD3A0P9_9GENT